MRPLNGPSVVVRKIDQARELFARGVSLANIALVTGLSTYVLCRCLHADEIKQIVKAQGIVAQVAATRRTASLRHPRDCR